MSTLRMSGALSGVLPGTETERAAIRRHLEAILANPVFQHSKRYSAVLRYVVERTLDGSDSQLKERTIGVEVFGRSPDYDTANDHVVRSAVAEIRKRLAQYYREDGNGAELTIEIHPGSYVPQFRWARNSAPLGRDNRTPASTRSSAPGRWAAPRIWERLHFRQVAYLGVPVVALLAVLVGAVEPRDPLLKFWDPVLSSKAPALLCVGTLQGGRQSTGGRPDASPPVTVMDFHNSDSQMVHVYDAMTFARLAGLLQGNHKSYRLLSQNEANFADLQNGPAVLVGLMNNDWTERLVSNLRFTIEQQPGSPVLTIRDRNNPSNHVWSLDYRRPYMDVTKDYALVLRLVDPKTEQMVVVAAGISVFGTVAAGEFVTDSSEMSKLLAVAPKNWEKKNMEIVLSTDVIRGKPGRPTILQSQFW